MANLRNLPLSYRPIRRFTALYLGLGLYATGMSLMIAARLGLDPWDVFHQGMSEITGWSFGSIVIVTGVVVLLAWIPLRQMPGIGTISNAVVIGLVVNAVSAVLPVPDSLVLRWTYALGGVLITGLASGLYIGARLGPGPRDGLMTGVVMRYPGRRFVSIRVIRTAIEATVLLIGWLLGGEVGWLTLIYAVSIGPLAHVMIPLLTVRDPAPEPPAPTRSADAPSAATPHAATQSADAQSAATPHAAPPHAAPPHAAAPQAAALTAVASRPARDWPSLDRSSTPAPAAIDH